MKKLGIVALVGVVLVSGLGVGCGGPQYVSNSVSDWYAQKYHETPWLFGNVISYGIYSLVYGITWMVDSVFVNTYHFWVKDAQPFGDGKGSTFDHKNPSPGKKAN